MSRYNVCDFDGDWHLIRREGGVEIWHNGKSGKYGVYLYEHEQQDEHWLLYAVRDTEVDALEKFNAVASLLR